MTKNLLYLFFISVLISGCYGNATMTRYYETRGLLTAMPSDLAEFDYKVVAMEYEPNAMADYDTSSRGGRERVVSELLKDKCSLGFNCTGGAGKNILNGRKVHLVRTNGG